MLTQRVIQAVLIIGIVLLGSFAVYQQTEINNLSSILSAEQSFSTVRCHEVWDGGLPLTQPSTTPNSVIANVMFMQPNSTATICVGYRPEGAGSANFLASVATRNGSGFDSQIPSKFTTTANPESVPSALLSRPVDLIVRYNITAGPYSKGIYYLTFTNLCAFVPLAVGYNPSTFNATLIRSIVGLSSVMGCIAIGGVSGPTILGTTSVKVFSFTVNLG